MKLCSIWASSFVSYFQKVMTKVFWWNTIALRPSSIQFKAEDSLKYEIPFDINISERLNFINSSLRQPPGRKKKRARDQFSRLRGKLSVTVSRSTSGTAPNALNWFHNSELWRYRLSEIFRINHNWIFRTQDELKKVFVFTDKVLLAFFHQQGRAHTQRCVDMRYQSVGQ